MKSSIKVEYDSIFSGSLGDKEPIVKVRVIPSDDPRDTLLSCIFTPQTKYEIRLRESEPISREDVYIISAKNRYTQVSNIAEMVYNVLIHTLPDAAVVTLITSNDEHYFHQQSANAPNRRSKGVNRNEMTGLPDVEITNLIVKDFLDFSEPLKVHTSDK